MTEFILKIEILIDRLLLLLPSNLFVEAPFLTALLADPNGRYVLSGVVVVTGLISLWVLLSTSQLLFVSLYRKRKRYLLQNLSEPGGYKTGQKLDEFQFFRRKGTNGSVDNSDEALRLIEQEMQAIRQKFVGGLVLKDAYVSETQRLYIEANKLRL